MTANFSSDVAMQMNKAPLIVASVSSDVDGDSRSGEDVLWTIDLVDHASLQTKQDTKRLLKAMQHR